MSRTLYTLSGVSRCYGADRALDCCTLTLYGGGITGIAGPNGSGKSTLLKLLAFIESPDEGSIFFQGREEHPFSSAVRHRVTLMPQTPFLMRRRVFQNVSYGLALKKDGEAVEARVRQSLSRVGLDFEKFAGRWPHELSGGESQRVALAARLILDPEVLILDEPTASVDAASSFLIKNALLDFAAKPGKTVILTSHDASWLEDVSDTVIFFFRGRQVPEKTGLMLFGPFYEDSGSGVWVKRGEKGAEIPVSSPPHAESVAAVPERCLQLGQGDGGDAVWFRAEVREVARRKGSPHAQVTLIGAGFPITLSCPVGDAPDPGAMVDVTYPLTDLQWL